MSLCERCDNTGMIHYSIMGEGFDEPCPDCLQRKSEKPRSEQPQDHLAMSTSTPMRGDTGRGTVVYRRAMAYAHTLATDLHRLHFAQSAPMWQPCDDLLGLLTQIDNMAAGLALRAERLAGYRIPGAAEAASGEAEYLSWDAVLRADLPLALPACHICGGTGNMLQDGTVYVCECGGSGVQMDDNEPYTGQPGWKLHRCPDGEQCREEIGGGCAGGWCAHFKVAPETLYPNLASAAPPTGAAEGAKDQPAGKWQRRKRLGGDGMTDGRRWEEWADCTAEQGRQALNDGDPWDAQFIPGEGTKADQPKGGA